MSDEEFAGLRHMVKLGNDLAETLLYDARHFNLDSDIRIALARYEEYREKQGL